LPYFYYRFFVVALLERLFDFLDVDGRIIR
jgi:hypothetical protein